MVDLCSGADLSDTIDPCCQADCVAQWTHTNLLGADWRQYNHFAMFVDVLAGLKNAVRSRHPTGGLPGASLSGRSAQPPRALYSSLKASIIIIIIHLAPS